ncbi:scopoletin glucosyltransferase-like [Lolium perenne]|uniref:scopoletin glucosyltransferase-like n=1 Tax=Lolium perenne TaxID=4522 RepID=UPI0021EA0851|nr:UDP-glycosyltransferase 73C4-like [Lolium perenne]
MACTSNRKKLRVLFIPFFATSHIEPFTHFAIRLAAAAIPDVAVEATVAVTPANVSIVQSVLDRHYGAYNAVANEGAVPVRIATYPFPAVEGLPRGVENLGQVAPADSWRIDVAAFSDALMRPAQEALVRAQSPDALVTDVHFAWNVGIAGDLGVPCVTFKVTGAFSSIAMRHLALLADVANADPDVAVVPRFPGPPVRIPRTELPEFLRKKQEVDYSKTNTFYAAQAACFGVAANTLPDLERPYCDVHISEGHVKRAYFIGPVSLQPPSSSPADTGSGEPSQRCIDWLDLKPDRSVVYLCFGSFAPVSDAQLQELALGLEASGESFVWVVRSKTWTAPVGWEERVADRGMLVTAWAPQTAILGHRAVGAFVTHCGWNSVLETVAAGVPVLTWPMVFEQFITERLLTDVLGIGERLWPHGAGVRSTRHTEHELVPAGDVARALTAFMLPGGSGDAARNRVMELAARVHAATAEGGSSHRDLRRLLDDLVEATCAAAGVTKSVQD